MASGKIRGGIGAYSTAQWTATSSSAVGTEVTGRLELEAGEYLIVGATATSSSDINPFALYSNVTGWGRVPNMFYAGNYSTAYTFHVTLPTAGYVVLKIQSSTATTYSNAERGMFRAIRIR